MSPGPPEPGERARAEPGYYRATAAPAMRAALRHFRGDDIGLRAGALTYISVFSLVPLVTLALLLLSSLHQEQFHDRLDTFVKEALAPGVAPGIRQGSAALLEGFIHAASSRAASLMSFLTLVFTAGTLLKNLDTSINDLWAVRKKRPWPTRVFHYGLALTLGPPLLAFSLVGTMELRAVLAGAHVPHALLWLGSFCSPVLGLWVLYLYAPNAPVRVRPALGGALVAGLGWSLAKVAYAAFAAQTFRYNLLYGSLGAAPLFLLWVYLSWLLVLTGARVAYAIQHAAYRDTWPLFELHPHGRELLAARIGQTLAQAWSEGSLPLTPARLATTLRIPEDTLLPVLDLLEHAGLVLRVENAGIHPSRDPSDLNLADTCAAVRSAPTPPQLQPLLDKSQELTEVEGLLRAADALASGRLREVSWTRLAGLDSQPPAAAPTSPPGRVQGGRNP